MLPHLKAILTVSHCPVPEALGRLLVGVFGCFLSTLDAWHGMGAWLEFHFKPGLDSHAPVWLYCDCFADFIQAWVGSMAPA